MKVRLADALVLLNEDPTLRYIVRVAYYDVLWHFRTRLEASWQAKLKLVEEEKYCKPVAWGHIANFTPEFAVEQAKLTKKAIEDYDVLKEEAKK